MTEIIIREPTLYDKSAFLSAMQSSHLLHHPWIKSPQTPQEFDTYLQLSQQPNQHSYLVCDRYNNIIGVFNVNEIIRGLFQNAYLGFYAVNDYANKGYMSKALKLILEKIFKELKLHRLEANIQPDNVNSIQLVKNNGFRYEGFSPRYLNINGQWCGHEHWVMTLEDYIRNDPEVLKSDRIDIVPYNSEWVNLACAEISKLHEVLRFKTIIDIQHVGSTAIPGIAAKPIIDLQIAVTSLEEIKIVAISVLNKIGYEYWYENPDPERLFFVKGMPPFGEKRTHHVHIVESDSRHWHEKILFRDYLIAHPEIAHEYEQLKIELAHRYSYDREQYTKEKTTFIKNILQKAQVLRGNSKKIAT